MALAVKAHGDELEITVSGDDRAELRWVLAIAAEAAREQEIILSEALYGGFAPHRLESWADRLLALISRQKE